MATNYRKLFEKDYHALCDENDTLKADNRKLKLRLAEKDSDMEHWVNACKEFQQMSEAERARNVELCMLVVELATRLAAAQKEIARLNGIRDTDGTNSGLPTSQTPIGKEKVIPNSREETDRKRGGQPGHAKHFFAMFKDEEVTETAVWPLESCPECNVGLVETGSFCRDEADVEIRPVRRRNVFKVYRCPRCGKEMHVPVPPHLQAENQYGPNIVAMLMTLMNEGNVTIAKAAKFIEGITNDEFNPSEGLLVKLQGRYGEMLEAFADDVAMELLKQKTVHWDDTVIMINKKRACLRFYGTEILALYKAHEHKGQEGVDDDGILERLPEGTTVVHDHNSINYGDGYVFQNAECNAHLLRDLKKIEACREKDGAEGNWARAMGDFIKGTNAERNALIEAEVTGFGKETVARKLELFEGILEAAGEQNQASQESDRHYAKDERNLIARLTFFADEYLSWIWDFGVPFTNNLAERGLRGAKSKMKASGHFWNILTAMHWARIKTYMETCSRNGINVYRALLMLIQGHPPTLAEVLAHGAKLAAAKAEAKAARNSANSPAIQGAEAVTREGSDPEAVPAVIQGGCKPEAAVAETREESDPEAVPAGIQGGCNPENVRKNPQGGHVRKQSRAGSLQGAGFG